MSSSEQSQKAEALLANDHVELDGLLHALLETLDEGDREAGFARLDLFWARLAMHIRAEHLHLFPAILDASDSGRLKGSAPSSIEAREAIDKLRDDHDFFMEELAGAVKTMRELLAEASSRSSEGRFVEVRRVVLSLKERLESHNRLEEETVYPLTALILEAAEQSTLATKMRGEIENLPPRFR